MYGCNVFLQLVVFFKEKKNECTKEFTGFEYRGIARQHGPWLPTNIRQPQCLNLPRWLRHLKKLNH